MSEVVEEVCQHCSWMEAQGISHTKVCHCSHHHNQHNFGGGCTALECKCDRYDQTEHTIRESRAAKIVDPVEEVDVLLLLEQAEKQEPSELVTAQARVDALRKQASTINSTVE